jgi:hypothetical protein
VAFERSFPLTYKDIRTLLISEERTERPSCRVIKGREGRFSTSSDMNFVKEYLIRY